MRRGVIEMAIIKPFVAVRRFYSTAGSGTGTGVTYAIAATAFTNDEGGAVTTFPSSFAYYNLYINGVLQTADTSTITTAAITIPDGNALNPAIPILVEFVVN
jgi:ribose 5-phosphate isomerase